MNNNADCTDPRPTREAHKDPDVDLIWRIGAGDQQAFEQLYNRYYHYLFRFIHRMTRHLESTEEIINDVMFHSVGKSGELGADIARFHLDSQYRLSNVAQIAAPISGKLRQYLH